MTGLVEGARASALTDCQADARAAPQSLQDPRQQDSSAARPNSCAEATRVDASGGEPPGRAWMSENRTSDGFRDMIDAGAVSHADCDCPSLSRV